MPNSIRPCFVNCVCMYTYVLGVYVGMCVNYVRKHFHMTNGIQDRLKPYLTINKFY